MKLLLSTTLIGINNLGTYHGMLSPEIIFDGYQIDQDLIEGHSDFNNEYFSYHFKNNHYCDQLVKLVDHYLNFEIIDELNKALNDSIRQINAVSMDSPKYYNYRDDSYNLDFYVHWPQFKKACIQLANNELESFSDFLKANYSSYDGFISFTSNNYQNWLSDFKEKNETAIGAILAFILYEIAQYDKGSIFYSHELYAGDFVNTTNLDNCIQDIKNGLFVKNSYSGIDLHLETHLLQKYLELDIITQYHREPNELNNELVLKYEIEGLNFLPLILETFNKIDTQTLKLF